MYRPLISAGLGRLHFVDAVASLRDSGVDATLLTGWIPPERLRKPVDYLGQLLGYSNLHARLRSRTNQSIPLDRLRCLPAAEALSVVADKMAKAGLIDRSTALASVWRNFGKSSIRHLNGHDLLHVRSGAGGGGLIREARRRKMPVLVDHSIAHPGWMDRVLRPVCLENGFDYTYAEKSPFWAAVLQDCLDADLLLVNSDFVKETFIEAGYPAEKIVVSYLGIPTLLQEAKQSWDCHQKHLRLLFTGTFCVRKGAHCLMAALQALQRNGIGYQLDIAGSNEIPSTHIPTEVKNHIRFHGLLPQMQLRHLMSQSDLYVFPTLAEGCAKSAMEALGAGLPVITTEACGLPKHTDCYICVPANDSEALANSITTLAKDKAARERSGRAAQTLVKHKYSWKSYAEVVGTAYSRLTELNSRNQWNNSSVA